MKVNALHSVAALVAGSFVAIASAQSSPAQPAAAPQGQNLSNANLPTTTPSVTSSATRGDAAPPVPFVSEPVASAIKTDGEGADKMNAIVQALNADPSLKNSKITVQMDNDVVLLTGAAMTAQQVKQATELARSSADNAMVVNTIQPDHIAYQQPEQELQAKSG